jgi:adenylate cyclase
MSSLKKNFLVLLILLVFQQIPVAGQNNPNVEIMQLKSKLYSLQGKEKAKTLLNICYQYCSLSTDSAFHYANEALMLSKQLRDDSLTGRSYIFLGQTYMIYGKDSLSLNAFTKSVEIFKRINDSADLARSLTALGQYYYLKGNLDNSYKAYYAALGIYSKLNKPDSYDNVINALNGISYIYFDRKDYKNALFYLHRALAIADKMNDNGYTVAMQYSGIGNVYSDWKQNEKALEYYRKAYEINLRNNNSSMIAYSLNDIGRMYFIEGHLDTAYFYITKAAGIFADIEDDFGISTANEFIGDIYSKKQEYQIALKYYKTALESSERKGERPRISNLLMSIGEIYYKMNFPEQALDYSRRSLSIAKDIGFSEYVFKNYKLLSDIYYAMDSCSNAYYFFTKYVDKKDSIFTTETHNQISVIQEKYESDKRLKEIKILKQNEEIQSIDIRRQKIAKNSFIIVTILLMILAIVIFYNYRMNKKANKIIASEKEKSDNLLRNILPEETAEELKREGSAKTRYYEKVSVLFTDFKGFTALSEKMHPEQLVAELDYCFKEYDVIIEKYGIEKIKTIGDSYMCAGGLPVPNTSNPIDVVKCGIEICKFMQEYKKNRIEQNQLYFEVRIGIHTGPVISGIVGSKKFAYDIWGDTVNTAARMESSGKPGCVNISGDTFEFVKDHFNCTYRGKVEAKNKGLIDMYFVKSCLS